MQHHIKKEFVIIGGQRCATGWLSKCISEHPQIFMSQDEARLFERNYRREISWGDQITQMSSYSGQKIIGEKTANYLTDQFAANRIYNYSPNMHIIAILRDPVDRIISQYRYRTSEPLTLSKLRENTIFWEDMLDRSRYAYHLKRFYALFPPEQIKVVFYEDGNISNDKFSTINLIKDIYDFLGVNTEFEPTSLFFRTKPSSNDQHHLLRLFLVRALISSRFPFRKYFSKLSPVLENECDSEIVQAIAHELRSDLIELQHLLGQSLKNWRTYAAL